MKLRTPAGLLAVPLILFLLACPKANIGPPATPEQHIAAYVSAVCGSETTKGANLDMVRAVIGIARLDVISQATELEILVYNERVANFCKAMPPIISSTSPWALKAIQITREVNKIPPPGFIDRLLKVPNASAQLAALTTAAETIRAGLEIVTREAQ